MKIYTGTGDGGRTSLFSGERLQKNHKRVEAYGTIDELCSFIGAVIAHLPHDLQQAALGENLGTVQKDLFVIGAILSTSADAANPAMVKNFSTQKILWLEEQIDTLEETLVKLKSFILPGGHPAAAMAQVARTVCRRAERCIQTLADLEDILHREAVMSYVNRLSDYLFVAARAINQLADIPESTWQGSHAS